jgi:hypothetical protein
MNYLLFIFYNRCVNKFDHHCKWLNNCIGEANYNYFYYLIICVFINSVIFSVFSIMILIILSQKNYNDE